MHLSDDFNNLCSLFPTRSENAAILLDCGDGTCAQINRFYGDESPEIYKRLKGVFISHMHADHFMGLLELFRMRKLLQINQMDRLCLIGPSASLRKWLNFSSEHIQLIRDNVKIINSAVLVSIYT